MNWETVNPEWWVPRGYACVRVDSRGSGKSPGSRMPSSCQEALDFYDAIEWAAKQPWCSGSVGTLGISYHASSQWRVANLKPPSLKCIMPWEGARRPVPRPVPITAASSRSASSATGVTTHIAHHLLGRAAQLQPRRVPERHAVDATCATTSTPARSAASRRTGTRSRCRSTASATGAAWRCTCAATPRATCARPRSTRSCASTPARTSTRSTPRKGARDQLRWFDHWLKGIDTGIMDEPPVKLEIRTGDGRATSSASRTSGRSRARSGPSSTSIDGEEPTAKARHGTLVKTDPAATAARSYPRPARPRPAIASAHRRPSRTAVRAHGRLVRDTRR